MASKRPIHERSKFPREDFMKKMHRSPRKKHKKAREASLPSSLAMVEEKEERKKIGGMKRIRCVWPYLKGTKRKEKNKGKEELLSQKGKIWLIIVSNIKDPHLPLSHPTCECLSNLDSK